LHEVAERSARGVTVSHITDPGSPLLLVGRERELAALRQQLDAALAGHGSLVLIGGEAGIGKTALAEALCHDATEQGELVLVGRCYDLTETPPYGLWVELFKQYPATVDLAPLPAAFAQRGTVGAITSQAALFQQVEEFFHESARQRPVALLLDDLHWADPASLDLLRYFARSLSALPLLLLATYRIEELTRRHPLYQLLPVLVRESQATRLNVWPLEEEAIRTLVATRYHLPTADSDRLVAHVAARAEGNPFFTGELLRALEEEGVLRPTTDSWTLGDLTRTRVPLLLRQVIDGRVARLSDEAQALLAVAAVIGQEILLDLWAMIGGVDQESLSAVVEHASEAHIIKETPDGTRACFAHALIRETLYEDILPSRRRRLHRQVAEELEQLPAPDFDALAYHYWQAGDARAERWLVVAGARAENLGALLTASERYEAALRLLEAQGGHAAERGWLLFYLARMHRYRDPQRSLSYLDEALQIALDVEDLALTAWATRSRGLYRCLAGQVRAGIEDMLRGEALGQHIQAEMRPWLVGFASSPTISGELSFHVSSSQRGGSTVMWLADAGRVAEACQRGEEILARAARQPQPVVARSASVDALWGLAGVYAIIGRSAEARKALRAAHVRYIEQYNYLMVYMTLTRELRLVHVPYETERAEERQKLMDEAGRAWTRAIESRFDLPDALVRYPLFQLEAQWPRIGEVIATVPFFIRSGLGAVAYWQGDATVAATLIDEVLPDGPASEPGDCLFIEAIDLQRVAAALAMDEGNLELARDWLEANDRWLAWSGAILGLAEGRIAWAAFHRAAGEVEKARAHAEHALVYAEDPRQPLALIGAHRLLGELEMDAGRFPDATRHLDASLALTDTCTAPFDRALSLVALAELRVAIGQRDAALPLLDEVRSIATPLYAMPLLARVDAVAARLARVKEPVLAYPAGLSEREVEVLRLVAAGRSNHDIADTLSLSEHTVRHHLTHILAKTDAANRAEAAAFALRHGIA
jgi:DNA-binding CsgD family transcriptional regulator